MLSPSDFNNAVPKFTNGNYASNPLNPQYIAEPTAVEYNRGAEPLQTLPAQWWNWFLNKFTGRFNKVNTYVKNIFDELTQLMTVVSMTPSGTESTPTISQLKTMFETEYPKYMALLMYPVGSIYWTGKAPNDGGDPNTLFGGTWVQIKDRFVWAKGDNDTVNATGGEKTHTLTASEIPSHNHSFTPAGSISVTTNPTFTGSEHSHTYTPAGSISVTTNPTFTGSAVNTGGMSAHSSGYINFRDMSHGGTTSVTLGTDGTTFSGPTTFTLSSAANWVDFYSSGTTAYRVNMDISHTHSVTAEGSISGGAYKFTGTQATLKATASGTISGGAYKFTGTAGTTGSKGDGNAHNNMPPYIVKYCWERTA